MRWVVAAASVVLLLASGCVGSTRTTAVEVAGNTFVFVEPTDQIYVEANATPPPRASTVTFTVNRAGLHVALWDGGTTDASDAALRPNAPLALESIHGGIVARPNRYQFCGETGAIADVQVKVSVGTLARSHVFSDIRPCPVAGAP